MGNWSLDASLLRASPGYKHFHMWDESNEQRVEKTDSLYERNAASAERCNDSHEINAQKYDDVFKTQSVLNLGATLHADEEKNENPFSSSRP